MTPGPTFVLGAMQFSSSSGRARYDNGSDSWPTGSISVGGTPWSCGTDLTEPGTYRHVTTP